ncbi:hypothetical protein GLYMA_17G232300v4 [Glycine max]|nr:hypothetical protein GLYMA_17G232300v4 [Glycine max]
MILVSHIQAPCVGAMFSKCCSLLSLPKFITVTNPPTFSNPVPNFITRRISSTRPFHLTLAKAEGNLDSDSPSTSTSSPSPSPFATDQTVFVTGKDVPLEGVIQFEKPASSPPFEKWGRVALLAGADVLALFVFSTIGRYSHGLSVLDLETLRTADPFIADRNSNKGSNIGSSTELWFCICESGKHCCFTCYIQSIIIYYSSS